MQLESHDLNSLRKLVRNLQDENERLKTYKELSYKIYTPQAQSLFEAKC